MSAFITGRFLAGAVRIGRADRFLAGAVLMVRPSAWDVDSALA